MAGLSCGCAGCTGAADRSLPAAPCLGHPVQRALLGRAASSPCPGEQAGVCSKGNYKNSLQIGWLRGAVSQDVQLRAEKALPLRAWNCHILEVRKKSCFGMVQYKDGCYCLQHL